MVFQGTVGSPTMLYALDLTGETVNLCIHKSIPNINCPFIVGGFETCNDTMDSKTSTVPTGLVEGETAITWNHTDNVFYRPW